MGCGEEARELTVLPQGFRWEYNYSSTLVSSIRRGRSNFLAPGSVDNTAPMKALR
jgi:hypothetical protein